MNDKQRMQWLHRRVNMQSDLWVCRICSCLIAVVDEHYDYAHPDFGWFPITSQVSDEVLARSAIRDKGGISISEYKDPGW